MTNQQKFYLLIVLIVAGAGASIYVNVNKNSNEYVSNNSQVLASNILNNIDNANVNKVANNTNSPIPASASVNTNTSNQTNNNSPTQVQSGMGMGQGMGMMPVTYTDNVSYGTPFGAMVDGPSRVMGNHAPNHSLIDGISVTFV